MIKPFDAAELSRRRRFLATRSLLTGAMATASILLGGGGGLGLAMTAFFGFCCVLLAAQLFIPREDLLAWPAGYFRGEGMADDAPTHWIEVDETEKVLKPLAKRDPLWDGQLDGQP